MGSVVYAADQTGCEAHLKGHFQAQEDIATAIASLEDNPGPRIVSEEEEAVTDLQNDELHDIASTSNYLLAAAVFTSFVGDTPDNNDEDGGATNSFSVWHPHVDEDQKQLPTGDAKQGRETSCAKPPNVADELLTIEAAAIGTDDECAPVKPLNIGGSPSGLGSLVIPVKSSASEPFRSVRGKLQEERTPRKQAPTATEVVASLDSSQKADGISPIELCGAEQTIDSPAVQVPVDAHAAVSERKYNDEQIAPVEMREESLQVSTTLSKHTARVDSNMSETALNNALQPLARAPQRMIRARGSTTKKTHPSARESDEFSRARSRSRRSIGTNNIQGTADRSKEDLPQPKTRKKRKIESLKDNPRLKHSLSTPVTRARRKCIQSSFSQRNMDDHQDDELDEEAHSILNEVTMHKKYKTSRREDPKEKQTIADNDTEQHSEPSAISASVERATSPHPENRVEGANVDGVTTQTQTKVINLLERSFRCVSNSLKHLFAHESGSRSNFPPGCQFA
jgi:hypothetical protein